MRRLTLRGRLVAATTVSALVAVAILMVGAQALLTRVTNAESLAALSDRADAAATTVRGTPGHVQVLEMPSDSLDQNIWVYDVTGHRVDGAAPSPRLARAVTTMSRSGRQQSRVVAGSYRLLARPVRVADRGPVVAVVVAGVDLRPYLSSERRGLWLSLVLGALIVIAAGVASWVAATYSLRRVHLMAQRADEWREHDLTGRFALGPPRDELTELAQTLDRMLDRITQVILAERRLTDEVAHELRNPLAAIRSEAQLALLQPDLSPEAKESLTAVVEGTDRMNRSISTILEAARAAQVVDQTCAVADVFRELGRLSATDGVRIDVAPVEDLLVAAPKAVVTAALTPIVDNALRHARSVVTLKAGAFPPRVLLFVEDDGAGVSEDEVELIFSPGHTSSGGGAGLGLPLARRLAHSLGGTVRAVPQGHGCFVVDLPGA